MLAYLGRIDNTPWHDERRPESSTGTALAEVDMFDEDDLAVRGRDVETEDVVRATSVMLDRLRAAFPGLVCESKQGGTWMTIEDPGGLIKVDIQPFSYISIWDQDDEDLTDLDGSSSGWTELGQALARASAMAERRAADYTRAAQSLRPANPRIKKEADGPTRVLLRGQWHAFGGVQLDETPIGMRATYWLWAPGADAPFSVEDMGCELQVTRDVLEASSARLPATSTRPRVEAQDGHLMHREVEVAPEATPVAPAHERGHSGHEARRAFEAAVDDLGRAVASIPATGGAQ